MLVTRKLRRSDCSNGTVHYFTCKSSLLLTTLLAVFFIAAVGSAQAASVSVITDKSDYPPGDSVVIYGFDYLPGESVEVQVTHFESSIPDTGQGHDPWLVVADSNGDFETYWIIPTDDHLDETLLVTATGLSSGWIATTTFDDTSTLLYFSYTFPDSICSTDDSLDVCAILEEKCGGSDYAPLEGRELIFFFSGDNCGVDIAQTGEDTVVTDADGEACSRLEVPSTPGEYRIRVKFLGESKPGAGDTANSACDPGTRVQLSAANLCEPIIVDPAACCDITISCPSDVVVQCDESLLPANTGTATAIGDCTPITVTYTDAITAGTCPDSYTITRTWTATDFDDNTATCDQIITVQDTTAPVLVGCPADVTVECDAIPTVATVTATDNCDATVTVVFSESEVAGACGQEKTITRTWTATDVCGNSVSCSQTITVEDTTAPVLVGCPADVTVECDAIPTVATVTATDNCDATVTVVFSESVVDLNEGTPPGACPTIQIITRTWTATDACGNSSSCSQTINVQDTTPPVISDCPDDVTVECDAIPDPATVTAIDACEGVIAVVFNESIVDLNEGTPPGACPTIQIITRTWTATDFCGNYDVCTQTITVQDTQPPVFDQACPTDITVECDAIPTAATMTANDVCEGVVTVTFDETVTTGNCPNESILTRTWTATDRCGNTAECIQIVTVEDNTAPVLSGCPATEITVDCNAIPNAVTVTALDNCDASVDVIFTETEIPGSCPITKIITRTWTATDDCDNSASCTQTIYVTDTIAPVLSGCPSTEITVDCNAIPDAVTVTATDICDGDLSVDFTESEVPGNCPVTKIITRTWTATDACGNSTSCTQTINVTDTIVPVLAGCPDDVTVECDAIPNPANVTATDICDGDLQVDFDESEIPGNCPTTKIITRTWTATDACGYSASCTQTITVQDNQAPVLSGCPDDITVDCNAVPNPATVTATDICDGDISVDFSESEVPGNCPNLSIITRTWTAVDICGNTTSCSQVITVEDTDGPVLTGCPTDVTVDCNAIPDAATVTAHDECDGDLQVDFTESEVPGNCPTLKIITRTWTAVDACGNTTSCSQVITVEDNEAPVLSGCPTPEITVECDAIPLAATVTAYDECDGDLSVDFSEVEVPGNCPTIKIITRTWTATDACGNSSSCSQVITVEDTIAPVLSGCPTETEITVECDAIPDDPRPTATDNCDGTITVQFGEHLAFGDCPNIEILTRTWTAVDACGNVAQCSQVINVMDTQAPTIAPIADIDRFLCDAQQVCATINADDVCDDAPTLSVVSGSGSIVGGQWCYTPNKSTSFTVTIKAEDECGNFSTTSFNVDIEVNEPPVCHAPVSKTINLTEPAEVCFPASCSDANNNLESSVPTIISGPGTISGGLWCYTPEGTGTDTVEVTLRCEDECGEFCETTFIIIIIVDEPEVCPEYQVHIEKTHGTLQGHIVNVALYVDSTFEYSGSMGAFEFLIAYDASALTFMGATPGQFIEDCGWEYFTYRAGTCGDCDNGSCPSGGVKIIGIAETNDGANHPNCLSVDGVSHVLANLSFLISNDITLNCSYVPIRFHWCGCTDNTVSSPGGDILYMSSAVFDYYGNDGVDTWIEVTDFGSGFPTYFGADYICENLHDPGKPPPQRCLEFYNGGIDIICSDSIDARGDINLDGLAYTISDAVMLVNYFVYGLQAFVDVQETNTYGFEAGYEGSIAASDVNADGMTLTVSDLVYLIRVIVGDADPYPKVMPIDVDVSINNGILSVNHDMGALFMLVEGDVTPQLLVGQAEMKYQFDGENTRVIVYSFSSEPFSGELVSVEGNILNLEMATYEGQPARTTLLPTEFSLGQNYPNPFNPSTQISFILDKPGEITLSIFNVKGQLVTVLAEGFHEAGEYAYQWEAGENASGIYLYRLEAGLMEQTRKMILLK